MNNDNHKRSSTVETTDNDGQTDWVGARQKDNHPPKRGGGYLAICTPPAFDLRGVRGDFDQRIDELRAIGLGQKWIQIAETIGFDHFMSMWAILDADNINNPGGTCERVRMWIPSFKRYLRYQRNRYILVRAEDKNVKPADVKKDVQKLLGESLTLTHIKRIIEKGNITEGSS